MISASPTSCQLSKFPKLQGFQCSMFQLFPTPISFDVRLFSTAKNFPLWPLLFFRRCCRFREDSSSLTSKTPDSNLIVFPFIHSSHSVSVSLRYFVFFSPFTAFHRFPKSCNQKCINFIKIKTSHTHAGIVHRKHQPWHFRELLDDRFSCKLVKRVKTN